MTSLPSDHEPLVAGKRPADTRVVVAMSGGVDSSVVAALLKDRGYDVVGVTLQLYDHGEATHRKGACCAGQDIEDARKVSERLGVPHFVLDYEARFREKVIDGFAQSYANGETPVPCVACNQFVKFADLFDTARDLGADILATGHYISSRDDGVGGRALFRARDAARDQSYFLFATTRAELEFLRFPLGSLTKDEARAEARRFGLPIADKPDSQDICFVPNGSYARLVERLRPEAREPGDIVDRSRRVLGRHNGIALFTVGQRKGLGIAAGEPLYVLEIEPAERRVVVGPHAALAETRIALGELNWLASPAVDGMAVAAKLRSTQTPVPARLYLGTQADQAALALDTPAGAVAPGQAAVLYDGDRVLGGGWIRRPGLTPPHPPPISERLWRDSSAG
jgi:tRNA-uridine 2-sulfurtransferase